MFLGADAIDRMVVDWWYGGSKTQGSGSPPSVGRSVPRSWLWIGLRGQMSDVAMEGRGKKGEVVGGEERKASGGGLRRDANCERN